MISNDDELNVNLRERAPVLYTASLFVPADDRDGFRVIMAFLMELEHVMAHATDPMMSAIRFTWWGEQLDAMPNGRVERHPLNEGMLRLVKQDEAIHAPLLAMVHAAHDALDNQENNFLFLDKRKALWGNMAFAASLLLGGGADAMSMSRIGEGLFNHIMTNDAVDKSQFRATPKPYAPLLLPFVHEGKREPVGPLGLLKMFIAAARGHI